MKKNKLKFFLLITISLTLTSCFKRDRNFIKNYYYSREHHGLMVGGRNKLYTSSYLGYYNDPTKYQRKSHAIYRDTYERSFYMKNEN